MNATNGERPVLIVGDGLVKWHDAEYRLTPQQTAILRMLQKCAPHFVPALRMATVLWPAQFPDNPGGSISVPICRMRKQLSGVPVTIDSNWGQGYRLLGELDLDPA